MKTHAILAVILIATGVLSLAYQGFTYTTREKIVDLGPLQMTAEKTRNIPITPIIGVLAFLGGIALLVKGETNE